MKKFYSFSLMVLFLCANTTIFAQCRNFAQDVRNRYIAPYIHDGSVNAVTISSGQSAQFQKVFYSGQNYRLVISGADNLPPVQLEVFDQNKTLLYSNKDSQKVKIWDIQFDGTQKLLISVAFPNSATTVSGCVSVLCGFLQSQDIMNQYYNE